MLKLILKPVVFYTLFVPLIALFSLLIVAQVNPFQSELCDMVLMSYVMGGIPSLATGFWIQNKIEFSSKIYFVIVSSFKSFMCSTVFALILLIFTADIFYGHFLNFLYKVFAFGCLGGFATFICVLLSEAIKKYFLKSI